MRKLLILFAATASALASAQVRTGPAIVYDSQANVLGSGRYVYLQDGRVGLPVSLLTRLGFRSEWDLDTASLTVTAPEENLTATFYEWGRNPVVRGHSRGRGDFAYPTLRRYEGELYVSARALWELFPAQVELSWSGNTLRLARTWIFDRVAAPPNIR